MRKIAIIGGIGSGKSVVSKVLRFFGYPVYDCDCPTGSHGFKYPAPVLSLEVIYADIGINDLRLLQAAPTVIPTPCRLIPLLAYVFTYIGHGGGVVAIDLYGGREAQCPAGQVVYHVALFVSVP